eukprot:scpid95589/ scgid15467/ 
MHAKESLKYSKQTGEVTLLSGALVSGACSFSNFSLLGGMICLIRRLPTLHGRLNVRFVWGYLIQTTNEVLKEQKEMSCEVTRVREEALRETSRLGEEALCEVCQSGKTRALTIRAPLVQDQPSFPLEKVAVDIMGPLPANCRGNRYLIVINM